MSQDLFRPRAPPLQPPTHLKLQKSYNDHVFCCENAQPADLPLIANLYQDAFPEAMQAVFGKPQIPLVAVIDVFSLIYRYERAGVIVARKGQEIAGFIVIVSNFAALKR